MSRTRKGLRAFWSSRNPIASDLPRSAHATGCQLFQSESIRTQTCALSLLAEISNNGMQFLEMEKGAQSG